MTPQGMILLDPHNHPTFSPSKEALYSKLSSGIFGLTRSHSNLWIIDYDAIFGSCPPRYGSLHELEKGFARVRFEGQTGYIIDSQETRTQDYHVLAIGCRKTVPSSITDPREAIDFIHRYQGVASLNHPYLTVWNQKVPMIRGKHDEIREELADMVDCVEVFNSQLTGWMKKGNPLGLELAIRHGKPAIAGSDSHGLVGQIGRAGVYVDADDVCLERLKCDLRKGGLERKELLVSVPDFVAGSMVSRAYGRNDLLTRLLSYEGK